MINKIFWVNKMGKKLFFIDAETDGLYGKVISAAVVVLDGTYRELERHYWGIEKDNLNIETKWVMEHVVPVMGHYEPCKNEEDLLSKVWEVWSRYCENAYAIADVCYPVEAGLFEKCVRMDPEDRIQKAPYPLIDLGSVLMAKGIDPLIERKKLVKSEKTKQHNALEDVEMAIEIWRNVID